MARWRFWLGRYGWLVVLVVMALAWWAYPLDPPLARDLSRVVAAVALPVLALSIALRAWRGRPGAAG